MSDFKAGDQVLIDGNLVATVIVWHPGDDLVVFESVPSGGGTNRTTAHISQTRIEPLHTANPEAETAFLEQVVVDAKAAEAAIEPVATSPLETDAQLIVTSKATK